jgi:hypothetical protein
VKYSYPVTGDLFMPEHWPIVWENYHVTWTIQDDKATAVTVTIRTTNLAGLPKVQPNPAPGVAANITFGLDPHHDEAESILRTAWGFLGFFGRADVDFDRPSTAWEAETEEERVHLQMHSYKTEPTPPKPSLPISYDLVARCFLAAVPGSRLEIPLSFMAQGRRAIGTGKYIDAFYAYFFFLETQFAPGYSNPKRVAEKFKAQPLIKNAFGEARKMAIPELRRVGRMKGLLAKADDAILDHMVKTRGNLHHHAPKTPAGAWHPEKHDKFEAEALMLSFLANVISQRQNLEILFDKSVSNALVEGAKKVGASRNYFIVADGGSDRMGLNGLTSLRVNLPGPDASHKAIAALDAEVRQEGGPYELMAVRGYDIKSEDRGETYASYRNNTFPPKPVAQSKP